MLLIQSHFKKNKYDIAPADDRHEKECLSFLKEWMRNATYKDDFKHLGELVEKKYDLSSWAATQKTPLDCESSLIVERILEKSMLSRINATGTIEEYHNLIKSESELISRMSSHFWSNEGEIVVWKALDLLRKIIGAIDMASPDPYFQKYPGNFTFSLFLTECSIRILSNNSHYNNELY